MAEQREIVLRIPVAYYRELHHIASDIHFMGVNEMAEKVVMTFVDNMREKLYPVIEDLNKEICPPTSIDAEAAEPLPQPQDK